jgi:glyoxylase-like metal-dependent hydrolase (beta-lactamase superfamily II)
VEIRLSWRVSRLLAPNPGPFTFKGTGVHILGVGARVVVIDPGPELPQHLDALKQALGSRTVSHILVTHTHRDHSPAAAHVKAWSGAKTYGIALARAGDHAANEGTVDEAHDHDFVPDVTVQDGMRISADGFELECVATPGHTANHVCYALGEERALFTGDHVMGWSTSVIAPPDGDMGAYLASLDRLKARDDTILYPTHGSPILDPQAWIGQLIAHRRMREDQIRTALARRAMTVMELVETLYPKIDPALCPAAAQQTLAHLRHMQARGEVASDDGTWRAGA